MKALNNTLKQYRSMRQSGLKELNSLEHEIFLVNLIADFAIAQVNGTYGESVAFKQEVAICLQLLNQESRIEHWVNYLKGCIEKEQIENKAA